YSGNLGVKQGLDILPQLAHQLQDDPRLHFVFCGDGAFRPQLEQMTAGLQNAVLTLAANAPLRREMGRAARLFAEENLGREQVLRRFEAAMQVLLTSR